MTSRVSCVALALALVLVPFPALAQSPEEIQRLIDSNNAEIRRLDAEIAALERQLDETEAQKDTLQNRIRQLDIQRKQLNAKISVTRSQINTTQLEIKKLSEGIADKEAAIDAQLSGLAETLRTMERTERTPLIVSVLSSDSIRGVWGDMDAIATLHDAIRDDVARLGQEKRSLTDSKTRAEEKRAVLLKQQQTLSTQQGSLEATRRAQNELLQQTKSQESAYQQIIAQKQAERVAFEAALFNLASDLEYTLDPSKIPTAGKGVLRWPLDNVFVTQQFGRTSDSGRLYVSGTHDGIDMRASIGTPVRASLTGTVLEVNHGAVRNCQYGKWVIIRHPNGLSTLYAHLSDVHVTKGQTVTTGAIIGYAGNTGYATGPHLHYTVYLSDALTFKQFRCKSGASVTIPIAPVNAYLNPLAYLP